jgi:hypothetical protein
MARKLIMTLGDLLEDSDTSREAKSAAIDRDCDQRVSGAMTFLCLAAVAVCLVGGGGYVLYRCLSSIPEFTASGSAPTLGDALDWIGAVLSTAGGALIELWRLVLATPLDAIGGIVLAVVFLRGAVWLVFNGRANRLRRQYL